jgi:predicted metal-dependent enzyme (double-stranded beta helix superfamily)
MAARPAPPVHAELADAVRELARSGDVADGSFVAASKRTLTRLLSRDDLLDALPDVDTDRFSRRLLFADPDGRFGIWVLTWPPGCQTPIHNHHCSCAFGIYRGRIDEIVYAEDADSDAVVESSRFVRDVGFIGGAPPRAGYVHEMLNSCGEAAVSVHIYAYRPDDHSDSIERRFVRRIARQEHP